MTGTQFREWMGRTRMSQVEVSRRTGWSQPFVSRIAARDDELGEHVSSRITQLMAEVAREDLDRSADVLSGRSIDQGVST